MAVTNFPGGSRSRVSRAGERVRLGTASEEDIAVIEQWRAAHSDVLNTFQALLRARAGSNRNIFVAQRHKRKSTILDKLHRYPEMQLARMDDVAGCRVIFPNLRKLNEFRAQQHRARVKHKLRNHPDRYDYIKQPKPDGYRGIHDVYVYNVKSERGKHLTGLLIEVQYRTMVQHAWSTAVEVIGFVTASQPKFHRGDTRYQTAMCLASEILSRTHERMPGPLPNMSNKDLLNEFVALDTELSLLRMLGGLKAMTEIKGRMGHLILRVSESGILSVYPFRTGPAALKALFEMERKFPESNTVLVKAKTMREVKLAFRNYFQDTKDFVRLMREAMTMLMAAPRIRPPPRLARARI